MISVLVCLLIAVVVAAAMLAVVRAVLALPPLASIRPYGGLFYALAVLIILLAVIQYCFPGHIPAL